jgi:integrase
VSCAWNASSWRDERRQLPRSCPAPAVAQANKNLVGRDQAPLPQGITPHSLRRTFASVLYALGEDPGVVMDEMGHTDPALALRVYRQAMRRGEDEKAALTALMGGRVLPRGAARRPTAIPNRPPEYLDSRWPRSGGEMA